MPEQASSLAWLDPLLRIMPTVPRPRTPLPLSTRLMWTFIAVTIYLLLSLTPLYGVYGSRQLLPIELYSIIFATSAGTLAHLGIGPIVIAGILLEILVFSGILNVDLEDPLEQLRFNALLKLLALAIAALEATVAVTVGILRVRSPLLGFAVVLQLLAATLVILLLDDLITNGWGIGSGISLFILVSIARTIIWYTFSPAMSPDGYPVGVIPAVVVAALHGVLPPDLIYSFYRGGTLVGLVATVLLAVFILYVELLRVPIPLSITQLRGIKYSLPLRVMYVSVLPIIFTAFTLALFSSILRYIAIANLIGPGHPLAWLACVTTYGNRFVPCENSLLYFLTTPPPPNITPQYVIVHVIIYVVLCTVFAYLWVQIAGMSAEDQAKYIVRSGLSIPGFRPNVRIVAKYLERYINALTITSGVLAGLIAALGDLLQVFSGGIGLMLLVEIALQYYAIAMQEHMFEMFPGLRRLLGVEAM